MLRSASGEQVRIGLISRCGRCCAAHMHRLQHIPGLRTPPPGCAGGLCQPWTCADLSCRAHMRGCCTCGICKAAAVHMCLERRLRMVCTAVLQDYCQLRDTRVN